MSTSTVERNEGGYSLIELVVCVALLILGTVVALGAVPALVRTAQAGIIRAAATAVARNAIERVRAAAAYYPPGLIADPATRAATTANHTWALTANATYASAARIRAALCGNAAPTVDIPLLVTTTYDASTDRITAAVSYPHDPCDRASPTDTITLAATLTPAQYAPQTQLQAPIADPALQ